MATELDHIVVGAKDLESGARWLEDMLGAAPQSGGQHATMATHNKLWSLGPSAYLELVAIDPDAPAPSRPRWFGLDDPDIQDSLASGPRLLNWAVRVDDIDAAVKASPLNLGTIHTMSRGDFTWKVAIREDGALIHQGHVPLVIQWQTPHPASALTDQGLRLVRLKAKRSEKTAVVKALESIDATDLIRVEDGSVTAGFMAEISTEDGNVSLVG